MPSLLDVRSLRTEFVTSNGVVKAVNDVSFQIEPGETLGVVGESGSGKSVTMLSIMGLIETPPGRIASGQVFFKGRDLLTISGRELRALRGSEIAMIFQDPMTSLNPVFTIGEQLVEAIQAHRPLSRQMARKRAIECLEMVGIPQAQRAVDDYPHQYSGGMRQRAMIAMALSCEPALLIADEPTTALDVTVQEQLLELVEELRDRLHMAVIWITHDLGLVAGLADRIIVMYAGQIVETAPVTEIFEQPRHPYTIGLLESVPRLDAPPRDRLVVIPGAPPDLIHLPRGCPFAPRCRYRVDRCAIELPAPTEIAPGHASACWVNPVSVQSSASIPQVEA